MQAKSSLGLVGVGAAIALGGALVIAGPLNPPVGPVAATYKTLGEVEPRIPIQSLPGNAAAIHVIAQPGSYYLTGPLTGVSGKKGIIVAAPNVTIDLCGFAMDGGGVGDDAIFTTSPVQGLTVRNGVISNWVKEGVDFYDNAGTRLENLHVRGSVNGWGLVVGTGSTVAGCMVQGCTVGIVTAPNCTVVDCTVDGNLGGGISVNFGSTLTRCTATGSTGVGAYGFALAAGVTLESCTARGNNGYGVDAAEDCTIRGCTVTSNKQGIRVASGGVIEACAASRNSAGHGIQSTGGQTTIRGCTASINGADGIRVGSNCLVMENTCSNNGQLVGSGGSGIFTAGNGNRIDSNITTGNVFGVALNGLNNLMVRNLSTGNSNAPYQLIAGNRWAQVLNNPAAGFVSTDPWANIQY